MTILPTTLLAAGLAAIINVWLAVRVGRVRTSEKVSVGDGGNDKVVRRMRAHANFVEFTPFVLLLVAAIELASGPAQPGWLFWVVIVYMVGRVAHAYGMDGASKARMAGILVTMLTLLGLGLYAIAIPYLTVGTVTPATPVDIQGAEVVPQG